VVPSNKSLTDLPIPPCCCLHVVQEFLAGTGKECLEVQGNAHELQSCLTSVKGRPAGRQARKGEVEVDGAWRGGLSFLFFTCKTGVST
jgi:hypothetical protein